MFILKKFSFLKSFIPRRIQILIRRELVRRKLARYSHMWPIDPEAAKPPERWAGWPEGKKFTLVLTHDVDTQEGHDKCHQLMDVDKRLGFFSSFNFVAEDYNVSSELLDCLTNTCFEVGQHGINHKNPFRSENYFRKQATKINHYLKEWGAVGFRSPSMYHNLDWLHYLNIVYDASTFDTDPFEPQPDGVHTIFPIWIPGNTFRKGFVELPYTLPQDFLLFVLLKEKNIDIWKMKLDWIAKQGGMALFITHPDYMNFNEKKSRYDTYHISLYESFLKYIESNYAGQYWNALPKDIAYFWTHKAIGK